jgi:hypothetical protein
MNIKKTFLALSLFFSSFLIATETFAAVIRQFDSAGVLTGATGVVVSGDTYNVRFAAGTCSNLFTGCDSVSDFKFVSDVSATEASRVLLTSVFYDFRTLPLRINGCLGDGNSTACFVVTPFSPYRSDALTQILYLSPSTAGRVPTVGESIAVNQIFINEVRTFAIWSSATTNVSVPVAPSILLLAIGSLALLRRKSQRG